MYYCNNTPDYPSVKPYTFVKFIFRTCDERYWKQYGLGEYLLLKVHANGSWTINGRTYSDKLLLEYTYTASIQVMITYEPHAKLQQVLSAYNYLHSLSQPLSSDERFEYVQRNRPLPDKKFHLNVWFLSGGTCEL